MADFCRTCWPEVYGGPPPGEPPEFNDFLGVAGEGMIAGLLCEGCGPGWFDNTGKKVPVA